MITRSKGAHKDGKERLNVKGLRKAATRARKQKK